VEDFLAARLDDIAQKLTLNSTGGVPTNAWDLYFFVLADHAAQSAAIIALKTLRLASRSAEASGQVTRDVVTPNRDNTAVCNATITIKKEFCGSATDINNGDANFFLILAQHSICASQWSKNHISDVEAAPLNTSDDVLNTRGCGSDQVHSRLEADAAHPDGVSDPVLVVDQVLFRENVENHAVGINRHRPCPLENPLYIARGHFTTADRTHPMGRNVANMAPSHSGVDGIDFNSRAVLSGVDGLPNGANRPVDVRHDPLAKASAGNVPGPEDGDSIRVYLSDYGGNLG
jgi:hypothetical protein